VQAIVDEAHRLGLRVSAHAIGREAVRTAVLGGVDIIEHGHGIDPETRSMMVDRGVFLVPTLSLGYLAMTNGAHHGIPEHDLKGWRAHWDVQLADLARSHEAGLRIALGTDLIGPPYAEMGNNALEFRLLLEAGLSPSEAIQAGTRPRVPSGCHQPRHSRSAHRPRAPWQTPFVRARDRVRYQRVT
jgi:imidazolonepropionase-like amidohydrolase